MKIIISPVIIGGESSFDILSDNTVIWNCLTLEDAERQKILLLNAIGYRKAVLKAARCLPPRKSLKLSQLSCKSEIDNYLVRRFGVEPWQARDITNTMTQHNL